MTRGRTTRHRAGVSARTGAVPASLTLEDLRKFHLAVEQSFGLVVISDARGVIEYVNPRFVEATGYSREEVLGQHVSVLSALPAEEDATLWETLRAGETWRGEVKGRRKDGEVYWLLASVSPIRAEDGTVTHFLGVNLDVTERKRMEEALRDSEAKFRTLAEASPMATFMIAAEGLLYINEAGVATYGYTRDEMLEMDPWQIVAPAFHAALQKQADEYLRGTRDHARIELKVFSKTGQERWVDFAAGFAELDGRRVAIGTSIDITDRKRAEEALRESEARLRAFAYAVPDAAFVVDEDGRCLEVLGLPQKMALWCPDAESLKGRLIHEVLLRETSDLFLSVIRTTIETQEPQVVEYMLPVGGGPRWFEGRTAPLALACDRKMIVWLAHDITERKNMEEALQALREELEEKAERRVEQGGGYGLTFRELTVLELIATGKPDKEIAVTLGISSHTANKHVAKILRKMHAASRTEASVRALREGLAG